MPSPLNFLLARIIFRTPNLRRQLVIWGVAALVIGFLLRLARLPTLLELVIVAGVVGCAVGSLLLQAFRVSHHRSDDA